MVNRETNKIEPHNLQYNAYCNSGAGLTAGSLPTANTAAASLAAVAGLTNTPGGVNMLALQHLFAGSPLTTGLPATALTNSVSGKDMPTLIR